MKKTVSIFAVVATLAMVIPAGATAAETNVAKGSQQATTEASFQSERLLVKFKPGAAASAKANVHAAVGGKDLGMLGEGKSAWSLVEVPKGQEKAMKEKYMKNPNVEVAELDFTMYKMATPNDPLLSSQYHHGKVNTYGAWDVLAGSNKTIAIIDTGIDADHPDLKGKLVPGKAFGLFNFSTNDDQGHGTHCAGIAAGTGNNGVGISGIDQTAKLMPVKVLNFLGSGSTSDIINGVYFAADNGADVLSMSLGGGSFSQAFQDAINYAWGKNKIIVAAAGNDGVSTYSYPAAYSNVVSVAATDENDLKTSWSNYGTWVDVAAPGNNIYSSTNDGKYGLMSGTSMATPLVSGLMALTWGKNPMASNAAVVDRVVSTADNTAGVGSLFLHGRVNAFNAVNGF